MTHKGHCAVSSGVQPSSSSDFCFLAVGRLVALSLRKFWADADLRMLYSWTWGYLPEDWERMPWQHCAIASGGGHHSICHCAGGKWGPALQSWNGFAAGSDTPYPEFPTPPKHGRLCMSCTVAPEFASHSAWPHPESCPQDHLPTNGKAILSYLSSHSRFQADCAYSQVFIATVAISSVWIIRLIPELDL